MPSVNYDRKSQNFVTVTDGSGILEEFRSHLVFPVRIVQKFREEEFWEQMALAKDR